MVRAGEESGKLDQTFLYLADYIDRSYELVSKARNALIYPAFIMMTFVAVMGLMLTVVIPRIGEILTDAGQALPIYTQVVLGMSSFLVDYGIFLLIAIIIGGYFIYRFLQTPGAKDVGIEFHSLSKTYNMTGWRIGMAVGNAKLIAELIRVKSNLDSGIPQAIQYMGIEALEKTSQEWQDANNAIYKRRRDRVVEVLNSIGLKVPKPKSGLYVWAKCPEGWTSAALATELLDKHAVVVTPGRGYGEAGEGYIRLSLTTPDDRVEEGLRRLEGWRLPKKPVAG
jgi:hypothetical protein